MGPPPRPLEQLHRFAQQLRLPPPNEAETSEEEQRQRTQLVQQLAQIRTQLVEMSPETWYMLSNLKLTIKVGDTVREVSQAHKLLEAVSIAAAASNSEVRQLQTFISFD